MKRLLLTIALVAATVAASAQNYAVVNSEKIFKSI
jgi:Skp family chaperone for outer membrane proteins